MTTQEAGQSQDYAEAEVVCLGAEPMVNVVETHSATIPTTVEAAIQAGLNTAPSPRAEASRAARAADVAPSRLAALAGQALPPGHTAGPRMVPDSVPVPAAGVSGMGGHLPALKKRALNPQPNFSGRPSPPTPLPAAGVVGPSTAYWNMPPPASAAHGVLHAAPNHPGPSGAAHFSQQQHIPQHRHPLHHQAAQPVAGPSRGPSPHHQAPYHAPQNVNEPLPVYGHGMSQEDMEKSEYAAFFLYAI